MTSISLNQTESEKRLHRILWFVEFLRASILHLILFSLAIGLYIAFGITGLYPVANTTIDYLRAQQWDSYPGTFVDIVDTYLSLSELLLRLALYIDHSS